VKDYGSRPWPVRHLLGRWLTRRECRAYTLLGGLAGLPRFHGRLGPCALALQWIDGRSLAEFGDGTVPGALFDRLAQILDAIHARGVALADLGHRDVLISSAGDVHVLDLAATWVLGPRPGALRRRLFEHFRNADRFSAARLRARFAGEPKDALLAQADPVVVAWHRRARRVKYCWDRLRGAPRLPPVDDHWRF
jgi:hypothetical protein